MEQQITIAKSIVSYFYKNLTNNSNTFEISDSQKCYSLLKQNYFVSDKDKFVLKEISGDIDYIPDEQKRNEFRNVLGKLLLDRIKLIDHKLDNSNFQYFKLCNASEDKIYFDPEISKEDLLEIKTNLSRNGITKLEFHNLKTFLNPGDNCRFMNPNTKPVKTVLFKKNTAYDLPKILKPYLREAKEIKFIDNYMANSLSIFHLTKLLKILNRDCNKTFITLSKNDYIKNKRIFEKAKKDYQNLLSLAKNYNVKVKNINRTGHLERYIVTDKYEISLPGGFDQFSKDGKPFIDNENKILKMVIERRSEK